MGQSPLVVSCPIGVFRELLMWDSNKEQILRAEVEKRFRARTPAKDIIDADWKSRVSRSEMRSICTSHPDIGELPPELDREWGTTFARWYLKMAKAALRELDPDWKELLKRQPPSPRFTREA